MRRQGAKAETGDTEKRSASGTPLMRMPGLSGPARAKHLEPLVERDRTEPRKERCEAGGSRRFMRGRLDALAFDLLFKCFLGGTFPRPEFRFENEDKNLGGYGLRFKDRMVINGKAFKR